ncbi:diacylglycerol O-acyltransferase [Rhodococcus sp. 27YEA15]|uniref:WS/DGAT/MGAT family O-acyltransferase n=1 Tax=Rhodococcus sp. 27YEA15 TaxID=3156259 RepID=UPI003C7B35FB
MVNRLTTQDAAFYFLEDSTTPMHVGSLGIFQQTEDGVDVADLFRLVEERLSAVPRYRQKVREVVFGVARPVWVDDTDFDITYHVRRSALPKPGTDEQLNDLIGRLTSRPLDRTRPLWEMYLVEGLSDNRFAIFTKSHSSLVDGESALEISQVLFDPDRDRPPGAEELWMPARSPGDVGLLLGALADLVTRPGDIVSGVKSTFDDLAAAASGAIRAVGKVAAVVRTAAQVAPSSPLNAPISRNRRLAVVETSLEDYRAIRARYGCEVNDVILTVITGALRNWLLSRGEPVTEAGTVRAMVPMSVYVDGPDSPEISDPNAPGRVSSFLIDLPVGEPNAVVRLSHVAHATEAFARQGRRVTAQTMVQMAGFAPATLHAMGSRVASNLSQRMFNLMITNAPGPQFPLYVGGAKMLAMYPVSPLLRNQTLSIALTSYDGGVYYGLNADRDAMADVEVVRSLVFEALEELRDASR